MIKSMTAYSSTILNNNGNKTTIEIKCLNSKSIDVSCKIPNDLKEKDHAIRKLISKSLQRGKVELNIFFERKSDQNPTKINTKIVNENIKQLNKVADGKKLELLKIAIQMPNSYKLVKSSSINKDWTDIKKGIIKMLTEINKHRILEGSAIEKDLRDKINNITKMLHKIIELKDRRIVKIKKKLRSDIVNLKLKIDNNRFEQELIYYLEKYDINEEIVRLKAHINFFKKIMDSKSPNGKKLGFISQEIGREINTLGAKSYDAKMQKKVVDMKDDLEKIKEQIYNIV